MSTVPIQRRELNTWKEVAEYLGITVRTAQNWEREQGLPIRRLAGPKARIWAFTDELDAWRENHAATAPLPGPRIRLWTWLLTAAILTAAGLAAAFILNRPGKPVRFETEGSALRAFDARNRQVWRFELPRAPIPPTGGHSSHTDDYRGIFADLERDGSAELIYAYFDPRSAPREYPILCIGRDGRLKWRFQPGREIATAKGDRISSNFWPTFVAILRKPRQDGGRILVVSHHTYTWPTQVAVLTAAGKLVAEYWHPGWLISGMLYDLDQDGQEEIILVGVNNSYVAERCEAALVVLDAGFSSGQSAPAGGDEYRFAGLPTVTEAALVVFPKVPFPGPPGRTWMGIGIDSLEAQMEVTIVGQPAPLDGSTSLHYLLDRNFRFLSVMYDASMEQYYAVGMPQPPPGASRRRLVEKALSKLLVPRNRFAARQ